MTARFDERPAGGAIAGDAARYPRLRRLAAMRARSRRWPAATFIGFQPAQLPVQVLGERPQYTGEAALPFLRCLSCLTYAGSLPASATRGIEATFHRRMLRAVRFDTVTDASFELVTTFQPSDSRQSSRCE